MITTWSEGIADGHMDEGILVATGAIVRRHPWWHARAKLTLTLLERLGIRPPAKVLDAGCGWGVTLEALEAKGYAPRGLDVSPSILAKLDRPDRRLIEADLTRPLPNDVETFDVVIALDVIEHLDDDRAAVATLGQLAKPGGGLVIVSVPARPDLFSEFDAIQGHRRRYLPDGLRRAFDETGLEVESVFWWGAWMVPILKRQRARNKAEAGESPADVYRRHLRVPIWPAPLLLKLAFAVEQPRALAATLETGTSLFAIARRNG
ncbi:2-polyprenyl-3-methyl-5-hydroxy-6-metoxy-1,4-benzoquinol methylase [Singulisphaera sp. GP187]|uniref:class I SAM-dependent methyltransferase n=1 Tax=Singulisphaera sp. GP187 TaxID=1882752 RepID=UPI000929C382|nr:class I SAM-dependent methyltransferase [Singulisphaera sp. GP187]SIO66044.1 2-polyprenyl-3-methyl-5-hydroxy-6-metoxy-1,4-benzoquinol methylase [Singulisphaera sp. GP187]